jgi:hypothetical protein
MNTNNSAVMDARKVERFRFEHVYCRFNPTYPKAWRGNTTIRAYFFGRVFRLSLSYRKFENDWMKVDTAKRWDVSPRFAKWLNACSYYAGNFRNMYHFHVGRIGFSIIPATSIYSA